MTGPVKQSVADRVAEVRSVANRIVDPCSAAADAPLGLVDMGIVSDIAIQGDDVRIELRPTFYGCLFVGFFEEELRTRLGALDWCGEVEVEFARDGIIWTEDLMTPHGRTKLRRRRALERRGGPEPVAGRVHAT